MGTTETSVNIRNDFDNVVLESDLDDDDDVVGRKSKVNVLYSGDEGDDGEISCTASEKKTKEERTESKETMEECEVKINSTNCSDERTDELTSDCPSTAQEPTDSGSAVKMAEVKNTIVEDDAELKVGSVPPSSSIKEDVKNEDEADKIRKKISNILDSDSEDERIFGSFREGKMNLSHSASPHSDCAIQTKEDEMAKPIGQRLRIVSSESEEDEELMDRKETSICKLVKPSKISSLIDSDSEDDNPTTCEFGGSSNEDRPMIPTNGTGKKEQPEKKKQSGSIRAAKEEAMREIQSESQRMLRESQVSLPYHRPRQRTLQEFLNRRKTLSTLPKTLTAAAKMKISGKLVEKVLEEKEKEAELFYKSSSDSDNEEGSGIRNHVSVPEIKQKRTVVENDTRNNSAIEETQKIDRNDLKNGHSVKDVIQQGDKSLGLPRKLFAGSACEAETTQDLPLMEMDHSEETDEPQDCDPRRKEFKQGLQNVSMPRRLFIPECDEPMNIDLEQNSADQEDGEKNDNVQETHEANSSQVGISNNFLENETIHEPGKNSNIQINESMEDEMEYFELKMSEDPYEVTRDKIIFHDIDDSRSSRIEFEAITETPFIDNREMPKLKEKKETKTGANIVDSAKITSNDIQHSSTETKESLIINGDFSCSNGDSDHGQKPFGLVCGPLLPEFDDKRVKKSKTRILPEIMRLMPKLQGSPGMPIELSPPKVGVNRLIQRFFNHSVAKKTSESCAEVTTVRTEETANGMKVVNEILPYRIPVNEKNNDPELSKPGAKLMRLKEELQQQMAIQRTKEWKQKELEMKTLEAEDVYRDELSDCGLEDRDDIEEDEDEEEEASDGEAIESDEDDLLRIKKEDERKRRFVDSQAEVSEAESDTEGERVDSDEEDREDGDEKKDAKFESKSDTSVGTETRESKRIVKAFDEGDSDDSQLKATDTIVVDSGNACHFKRTRTDADMFATDNNSDDDWLSGTEEDLPVYQQRTDERSQSCATPSVLNNSLSIVSPITQLTALNTGSETTNTDSPSGQNPFKEIKETPNDTEQIGLCSGQFSDNPGDNRELATLVHTARETSVSDAELLELCSGTFASQPPGIEKLEGCDATDNYPPSTDKLAKVQSQKPEIISGTLRIVSSSDEENDGHDSRIENVRSQFKKRVKKLILSDEEDESDTGGELSDFDEKENVAGEFVDYDSEENEIVIPKNDTRKAAARFLDEEAELSESEWGSADEDENGLDKLDWEEGDLEDIDQDQVKKQLEKIQMRQVLDADQREVRLLQEILLEDGELHSDSASRQRKFKWKNIDEMGENSEGQMHSIDDEGVLADSNEAESELEWRKQRLERETFLQEQRIKDAAEEAEEETEEDSQLFQLGIKALKKNKSKNFPNKDVSQTIISEKFETSVTRHTVGDLFASPECGQKPFALKKAIQRGSFLARGEKSLAKLSVITKRNSDQAIIKPKNSRNFVFAHLSPAIEETAVGSEAELNGQKNTHATNSKFRKRKPPSSLTPVSSKKSKKEYEGNDTRNKLFA